MDGHLMPSQIEDGVLGSKAARGGGGAQMTSLPALVRKEKKEEREKKPYLLSS